MSNNKVFDKYIVLYNKGVSIRRVNPIDNETYRILSSSNIDIRIIDRDSNIGEISTLSALTIMVKDTDEYSGRFFYAIPIQTVKGTIVGFIFRSVFGKHYVTVNREFEDRNKKLPLMFGFYDTFKNFDNYDTCKPIIICEGLKDCIVLKKIYPYVLANNTSSMGINLQVLSNITNKFILIYDNDSAGKDGMEQDIKNTTNMKYNVIKVPPKSRYKDCAECYDKSKEDFKLFAEELTEKIAQIEDDLTISGRRLVRR